LKSSIKMKIEQFFQRRPRAAATDKPLAARQGAAAAELGKTKQLADTGDVKDTLPNCDRDVDKVRWLWHLWHTGGATA
jgi:hypothetical protein